MIRLLCACGKKLRVPREASARSSKGRCPACKAPFRFVNDKWVCVTSEPKDPKPSPQDAVVSRVVMTQKREDDRREAPTANQAVAEPELRPAVPPSTVSDEQRTLGASSSTGSGDSEIASAHGSSEVGSNLEADTDAISPAGFDNASRSTVAVAPASEPVTVNGLHLRQFDDLRSNCVGMKRLGVDTPAVAATDPLVNESLSAYVLARPASIPPQKAVSSEDHSHQLHRDIREAICESLRLGERYTAKQAAAISLACHPWPDQCLRRQTRLAIASELLPGFNANHPSFIEIAADRLLRFAEAVRFEGEDSLAIDFSNAARALIEYQTGGESFVNPLKQNISVRSVVASPTGAIVPQSGAPDVSSDHPEFDFGEVTDGAYWKKLVHALLSGAYQSKSRDVGVICGASAIGIELDALAVHLGVSLPDASFDTFLNSLSTRDFDILKSRSYVLGSVEILESIAGRWGVTRERVRQIETKVTNSVEMQFSNVFKGVGEQALQPLRTRVVRTTELHSAATAIAEKSEHAEMLAAFMLKLFGPWKQSGNWSIHEWIADDVSSLDQSLALESDQYGFIDDCHVESTCSELFCNDADRDEYLLEVLGLGRSFGNWTIKSTMKCLAASAIKKIGRPATKEELSDLIGLDGQRITNILGNIEGVARADRYRWGFIEWIDDVYDGIVGEIEQRIDAYNGSVPVHVLLTEIPSQFDVAEGSVRSYLASSAFVVENDMVRRAEGDEYSPRHPETCKDAIRVGDYWGYRSLVYERHFNGYSLGVNFDVAYANGIRPGDDLVVPIEGADDEASLIWRPHSLNRLVDVGRVSEYLKAEDYRAGDRILIVPSSAAIKLIREDREPELSFGDDSDIDTAESNGSVDKVSDPLLDLLGGF
ncbi:hypothetical protein [Rosistilla ulvae]|nr:hypothetical protein [Rosistilla ulvae]